MDPSVTPSGESWRFSVLSTNIMTSTHLPNHGRSESIRMHASGLRRRFFLGASALSAASILVGLLTGCGSTKIQSQESVGQQLLDLEKSYKDGIITEREYKRLKQSIIRKND